MVNCDKKPMFSPEQRLELIRRSVADLPNVEAELYSGLLADYARQKGAGILVKGVRNTTDFDLSINRRPSTGASARSWRRCCCRPVRPISTSAKHYGAGDDPVRPAFEKYVPAPVAEELKGR